LGCIESSNVTVTVNPLPVAGFTYSELGGTVTFTDTSSYGVSYFWDFDDAGSTSTDQNPTYIYGANGDYNVMQVVTNGCGSDTVYQIVKVTLVSVYFIDDYEKMIIYPNPNNGLFVVNYTSPNTSNKVVISITDLTGKTVFYEEYEKNQQNFTTEISLDNLAKSIYQMQLMSGDDVINAKVVVNSKE